MKNKLLSRFDPDNLRKTLIYLIIALLLITVSFVLKDIFSLTAFIFGFVIFFYAALHPWEKPIYYLILVVASIILFLILIFVGIGILMKTQLSNKGEGIAWIIGGVCIAGFIAGIIGMLRFRKYD